MKDRGISWEHYNVMVDVQGNVDDPVGLMTCVLNLKSSEFEELYDAMHNASNTTTDKLNKWDTSLEVVIAVM